MQSGDLDHLYEVLERKKDKNSAGETVNIWVEIGKFYGEEVPVSAQTFASSGAAGSAIVIQVNMRPSDCPALKAEHVLRDVDSENLYAITGILPVGKDKHRLMCTVGKI